MRKVTKDKSGRESGRFKIWVKLLLECLNRQPLLYSENFDIENNWLKIPTYFKKVRVVEQDFSPYRKILCIKSYKIEKIWVLHEKKSPYTIRMNKYRKLRMRILHLL